MKKPTISQILEAYDEAAGHIEVCAGEEQEILHDEGQARANEIVAARLRTTMKRLEQRHLKEIAEEQT
jgi:hypothetical protein